MFSIVMIARNESKTLPRLLESVKDFIENGGEVIVCDTGSADDTEAAARNAGCKVASNTTFRTVLTAQQADELNAAFVTDGEVPVVASGDALFDFAAARNFASSLASNDWIAMPDCDEIYTTFDWRRMGQIIEGNECDQFVYDFVFARDNQGRPTIEFAHSKFYNRTALKWVGVVHEILSGQGARQRRLGRDVIFLQHWQNPDTDRKGYMTGLAWDVFHNPNNDRNTHYFARELLYWKRYRSAIKMFERHLEMKKWPEERAQSVVYIGDCQWALGEREEAFASYHRAIAIAPHRRVAWIRMAWACMVEQRWQEALSYASAALEIHHPPTFYSDKKSEYRDIPHVVCYRALMAMNRKEEAVKHVEKGLMLNPNNEELLRADDELNVERKKAPVLIPTLRLVGQSTVDRNVVLVLKGGGEYKPEHVHRLAGQMRDVKITLLTDESPDLFPNMNVIPLKSDLRGYWAKMEMFRPDVLPDKPFLYLDLDSTVNDFPDKFFTHQRSIATQPFNVRDYNARPTFHPSGMMFMHPETRAEIWRKWCIDPAAAMKRNFGDDDFIHETRVPLDSWMKLFPQEIVSYKLNWLVGTDHEGKPLDKSKVMVICFHEETRPWHLEAGTVKTLENVQGLNMDFPLEFSSSSDSPTKTFRWTAEKSEIVVMESIHMDKYLDGRRNKYAWIAESIALRERQIQSVFDNLDLYRASYIAIFTCDKRLVARDPLFRYTRPASSAPWTKHAAIKPKTKNCSLICSTKLLCPGHHYRLDIAKRLAGKVDLFGGALGSKRTGDGPWPSKAITLDDYRFQIAIENAQHAGWFTEKITDCFANGVVPVYWGDPDIGDFFNTDGIIRYTDDFDISTLTEELYESMKPAILDNFERVQKMPLPDDYLYETHLRDGLAQENR